MIVRKSDGWLVDFWTNAPTPPTVPELGATTAIDGMWLFHPVLWDGRTRVNLTASSVRIAGDAIETESEVSLGAGKVRVVTDYRLDGDKPRVIVDSRVEHMKGGRLASVGLGDAVKWGNVDYFLQGVGRAPPRFFGHARWIGRKGACGDLVLTTAVRVYQPHLARAVAGGYRRHGAGEAAVNLGSPIHRLAISSATVDAPRLPLPVPLPMQGLPAESE